ncbi:MAG: ComF family protein [Anaerolineae bacterium]|nr:ComF family protein [Anaerolineae bacterium]
MRCQAHPHHFATLRGAFYYDGTLRAAIRAFKYGSQRALANEFAEAMRPLKGALVPPGGEIRLVAVPLHPERERTRGYNQAYLLAEALAAVWELPLLPREALWRTRHTPAQVGQNYAARQANVEQAFAASHAAVTGYDILVIDDVCTTGATIDACADALLSAGARSVSGATLARAV